MKLIATLKLQPTDEQRQRLYQTLECSNAACNYISEQAWTAQVFGHIPVHRLTYKNVRMDFKLGAQLAVRCIGKVVDAYKLDKKVKRLFKKFGAVPYDERNLNFRLKEQSVSIWLLGGRERISFVIGIHQQALLHFQHGESDLVHRKGEFYLYTTCDVPHEAPIEPEGWLGVDLGIVNIATDSDGDFYQGNTVKGVRFRYRRLRSKLQRKGTLGAYRRLRKLAGKEARFATHTNHTISKQLVKKAQDTRRGIALEELTHIRARITVRKSQRAGLYSWSFSQLRRFVEYKARRVGIPVVAVDPRNTSRMCPDCGHTNRANRPTQERFSCIQCGFAAHADYVAAVNIGRRGAVNHPYCSDHVLS